MSARRAGVFDANQTASLLAQLDDRLRARGVAAAVFVVGGAAIAATGIRAGRLTQDIDALSSDRAVAEEARAIATEQGLSPHWLNGQAGMWMPPLPDGVLDPPSAPGLRVTYADEGFLLATKLVAQRAKDAEDLRVLAGRLGLERATPQQLENHIRAYYTDDAALEMIVGGQDVDAEVRLLAHDAARMLHRASQAAPTGPAGMEPRRQGRSGPGLGL